MKIAVLVSPGRITAPVPLWQTAAPTSPPIRAWEEEVGRPSHHVRRFQEIAPTRAERRTWLLTASETMIPLPTIFATATPRMNTARKLKNAAQRTAKPGVRTRVETTVAIELAAS